MGDFTPKQKFYLCCGCFCSMLACIGVYFWLVLFYMESQNAPYLVHEMQHLESITANKSEIDTFKWSFLITAIVSIHQSHDLSNNVCP